MSPQGSEKIKIFSDRLFLSNDVVYRKATCITHSPQTAISKCK
jgi:hypothetical protein